MEYFLVVIKRDENVFLSVFSLRRCKKEGQLIHGWMRIAENKELAPMAAEKVFTVEDNTLITGNPF